MLQNQSQPFSWRSFQNLEACATVGAVKALSFRGWPREPKVDFPTKEELEDGGILPYHSRRITLIPIDGTIGNGEYEQEYTFYQFTVLPGGVSKLAKFTTLAGIDFRKP